MGVGLRRDAGTLGSFGGMVWLEWYDNRPLEGGARNGDLQEVDYSAYWSCLLEPIAATLESGWIAYTYPQNAGDEAWTHEWYAMLCFDDSRLFGTEKPVLSPYVAYYLDLDDTGGSWLEWGISHRFTLSELATDSTPILKYLSLTPSLTVAVDHGQLSSACRAAGIRYGLDVYYDLSAALELPEDRGRLAVGAFVYFLDALAEEFLKDRLYGGVTLSYSW